MMECNKDEAVRARHIAESKMNLKDFNGAKKFITKAQQLFPELDGISHMLTVCEVHCAAEVKTNGIDDWYGILQVQPLADESLIKKQYRKFALLLHPDKNKFPGAEAAFKLVGEAHRILSDQSKRSLYDIKRTSLGVVKPKPPATQTNTSFPKGQATRNNFQNVQFQGMNHEQQQQSHIGPTFWTSCPFCRIRYQYYRTIMNRSLRCQNCLKPFVAYDLNSQPVPMGTASVHANSKGVPGQNAAASNHSNVVGGSTASQQAGVASDLGRKFGSNGQCHGVSDGQKGDNVKFEKVNLDEVNRRGVPGDKTSGSPNKKRNRRVVESSDSEREGKDADTHTDRQRRSHRQKQNISYNENCNAVDEEAEDVASLKRLRKGKFSADEKNGNNSDSKGDEKGTVGSGVSPEADQDVCDAAPEVCHYPDPEFYDFDQKRNASLFAVGQFWALYDDSDGMPRFYAQIRKIGTSGFKVRFTWLEHDAESQSEIDWSEKELPVGSGNFKLGFSQTSVNLPMFSHVMMPDRGVRRHTYVVRPRRNEIWALFKDWDMNWAYEQNVPKPYVYEIVEILSDDSETGTKVIPLVKVEGFVSLFARSASDSLAFFIHSDQKLRFSHMIPSYKLSGSEREGIPPGSYELDPAALPLDLEKISPVNFASSKPDTEAEAADSKASKSNSSDNLDAEVKPTAAQPSNMEKDESDTGETGGLHPSQDAAPNAGEELRDNIEMPEFPQEVDPQINQNGAKPEGLPVQNDLPFEYPESEFHDFGSERSFEKLQCGQIWALYSDIDGFPKFYALIKDIDLDAPKVHVYWLEGCPLIKDESKWADKELPFGCGQFKVLRSKNDEEEYNCLDAFSHLVPVKPSLKKLHYEIFPCVGEVWALYRNWSVEWSESDLSNCEYDAVEILETDDHCLKVLHLKKTKGYNAVFEPMQVNGQLVKEEISRVKLLQFSHCIPAYRLTEERGGKLRGFWELDPAAVPELLLCD